MGDEEPASSGAESVLPKADAALSAVVPRRAVSRPFPSRPFVPRVFVPLRIAPRAGAYTDPVTWATAVAAFGAYTVISLFRLMQLNPSSWDLGIYTEYIKQYADLSAPIVDLRAPGFNLLGDHFQPIVAVLAPFFRVFPSSATLVVGQALLAAASIFPVSQLAREKLGTGPGRAIAVAYGFSWGLQQLAQFDFHEIAFAVPLLAFSLSALARGHAKAAVGWALPLVFVKEDQGFTVAAIGIYLIVAGLRAPIPDPRNPADPDGRGRIKAGQFLLIWGFAWSFVAIGVIIPHFSPVHLYQYWSDGGVLAPGGHPSVFGVIRQLLHAWPDKLQTLIMLLLPTAFIALRSPLVLIAVPSLLLRFIATDSAYWGTYWHYNATVMPVIFVAAIDALARIGAAMDADAATGPAGWASGRRGPWRAALAGARRYGAAMMVAIAVPLALQFPLNQLWNAQTYRTSPHVAEAEAAMARVPDGASVLATLDLLAPLAARTDTYWIGNSGNPRTQYIVFDGADSDYTPAIKDVPAFIAGLYPPGTYTEIYSSGDVYVFRLTR
ncbi:MAG TPA: DUF2079 domain-containing protein [Streptosporangiaceae bacterium]|nr:DUF2079 domain-containing protein [Streptosporangiaceae bacterium]